MQERKSIPPFKAGDTFDWSGQFESSYLPGNGTWAARAHVIDMGDPVKPRKIDELTCTLTAPIAPATKYTLRLYRASTATKDWPRPPNALKTRKLQVDVEFYDNSSPPIQVSSNSFDIPMQYDPTRV